MGIFILECEICKNNMSTVKCWKCAKNLCFKCANLFIERDEDVESDYECKEKIIKKSRDIKGDIFEYEICK